MCDIRSDDGSKKTQEAADQLIKFLVDCSQQGDVTEYHEAMRFLYGIGASKVKDLAEEMQNVTSDLARANDDTERELQRRVARYINSHYTNVFANACRFLNQKTGEIEKRDLAFILGESGREIRNSITQIVLTFYARHPEIDPTSKAESLPAGIVEEIKTITEDFLTAREGKNLQNPGGRTPAHRLHQSNSYSIGHSKPFNHLLSILPGHPIDGQLEIVMYPSNAKLPNVITYMSLTYTGDAVQLRGRRALTGFDKAVYNTLSTLWNAGNSNVTPYDILRYMNGRAEAKGYSKAQIDRVNNSIRKMMSTILSLDMRDDMQQTDFRINDDRVSGCKIETQLLQATRCELRTETGRTVEGWSIDREPIMYTYNKAKKQIVTVPIGLLDTSAAVSNTEDVIAIREYLLLQIENMRTNHRHNNVIRYDTLYNETGIEAPKDRVARGRQRTNIKGMLDLWRQRGYISEYSDWKEKGKIEGIQIHVTDGEAVRPSSAEQQ